VLSSFIGKIIERSFAVNVAERDILHLHVAISELRDIPSKQSQRFGMRLERENATLRPYATRQQAGEIANVGTDIERRRGILGQSPQHFRRDNVVDPLSRQRPSHCVFGIDAESRAPRQIDNVRSVGKTNFCKNFDEAPIVAGKCTGVSAGIRETASVTQYTFDSILANRHASIRMEP
jgi:hypothetical protein